MNKWPGRVILGEAKNLRLPFCLTGCWRCWAAARHGQARGSFFRH